jgi:hypothetical protein
VLIVQASEPSTISSVEESTIPSGYQKYLHQLLNTQTETACQSYRANGVFVGFSRLHSSSVLVCYAAWMHCYTCSMQHKTPFATYNCYTNLSTILPKICPTPMGKSALIEPRQVKIQEVNIISIIFTINKKESFATTETMSQ